MNWRTSPPAEAFLNKGFPVREYFPHRAAIVRKQYPDTYLLMESRGMTVADLSDSTFLQLNLYSDHIGGFPDELFTSPSLNWHQQQLGEKGLIAAACLCIQGSTLLVCIMQSDICQQLYRHPDLKRRCKAQLQSRFGAWHKILFNAILDLAIQTGIDVVCSPTAEWVVTTTKKQIDPALFTRIYNFPGEFYVSRRITRGPAEYWEIPVAANADRVVRLSPWSVPEPDSGPLIAIFHDTEENVDTAISADECRRNLTRMLAIEKEHDVRATYDIVGKLFRSKRSEITASGPHALAFHSWDHDLNNHSQLPCCRRVDLQVRGYRPPQSRMTPELTDYALSYHNFEWIACGRPGFEKRCCDLKNGIVRIPIFTDDYPLAIGKVDYTEWRGRLLADAAGAPLFSFGLHDCYAGHWLDGYAELLETLAGLGRFVTADELSDMTFRTLG